MAKYLLIRFDIFSNILMLPIVTFLNCLVAYYRIEIHLKSGKVFKVIRDVDKRLDEYYLDINTKARNEYKDDLAFFELVQLSRHSPDVARLRTIYPSQQPQEEVYNSITGKAVRESIKHRSKGSNDDKPTWEERINSTNNSANKSDNP